MEREEEESTRISGLNCVHGLLEVILVLLNGFIDHIDQRGRILHQVLDGLDGLVHFALD